jgi:hypothetical protein
LSRVRQEGIELCAAEMARLQKAMASVDRSFGPIFREKASSFAKYARKTAKLRDKISMKYKKVKETKLRLAGHDDDICLDLPVLMLRRMPAQ